MSRRAPARRRILVIEEDADSRLLLTRALASRPQVELVEASTAVAGTISIAANPPDLLILDSQLPDMPGTAVLEWVRTDPSVGPIPVIVVSADARQETIDDMLAAGADEYLTKPIDLPTLLVAIDRLLLARTEMGCPTP